MKILNEEDEDKGTYFIMDNNKKVAEMTYTLVGDDRFVINHTRVSEEKRGQGLGRHLIDAIASRARAKKKSIVPVCSYAKHIFQKDESLADVL